MKTIRQLNPERLNVDEHIAFQNRVAEATRLLSVEMVKVKEFNQALADYKAALINIPTMELTADLQAIDKLVCKLWQLLKKTAHTNASFPLNDVSQAAQIVYNIVIDIGNPLRKGHNTRMGIIARLFNQLDNLDAQTLENAMVATPLNKLREQYNLLLKKYAERNEVKSTIIIGIAAEKRSALNNAYCELINYVNAVAVLEGSDKYQQFIDQVDKYIEDVKQTLSARRRKYYKKKKAQNAATTES